MGRAYRHNQPGHPFHIVARTQGQEPWFNDELAGQVQRILGAAVASSGARLIALAVMPNHLHVVLFQGQETLGTIMQPALRRIALLVHRYAVNRRGIFKRARVGHVFERRFRSRLCNARHLLNSISYVHRNPVEAMLCKDAADYPFTTHRAYLGLDEMKYLCLEEGLKVFTNYQGSIADARDAYLAHFNRLDWTRILRDDPWLRDPFAGRHSSGEMPAMRSHEIQLTDLKDTAERLRKQRCPELDPDRLRSSFRAPAYVEARRDIIGALQKRGYAGVALANYFRVSPQVVSAIRVRARWADYEAGG